MCGGRGIRIKSSIDPNLEKPLVKINNKPIVEYLINTLIQTNRFEKIFAAVSGNTCRTREYLKIKFKNKITLLETSGGGYSNDYAKMIRYFTNVWNNRKMGLGRILFLPIDIPLISSMLLNQVIDSNQKKPCLAIVLEKNYIQKHGLLPTKYELMIDNKKYCYSGISMIDVSKIDGSIYDNNKFPLLDEEYLVLNNFEIACNINTSNDLEIVKKILENTKSK